MNRRGFLRLGARAAAAVGLVSVATSLPEVAPPPLSEGDRAWAFRVHGFPISTELLEDAAPMTAFMAKAMQDAIDERFVS